MNNEAVFDKIERYLFGDMEQAESLAFEAELAKDSELQAQLNLHRMEHEVFQMIDRAALDTQFASWKEEKNSTTIASAKANNTVRKDAKIVNLKVRRRFRLLSIAASFLLAVGLGLGTWSQVNYSNTALSMSYLPETSFSDKSNVAAQNPLLDILELMEEERYQAAIEASQQLVDTDYNDQALLLKAEAALRNEDTETAYTTYDNLLSNSESLTIQQTAAWGKALSLLKDGKEEEALQAIQAIADNDTHIYQKEATELEASLNGFWHKITW
ncbi:MAG: hypothetical protein AAF849_05750 [Bacteroidota bacterium]